MLYAGHAKGAGSGIQIQCRKLSANFEEVHNATFATANGTFPGMAWADQS